MQWRSSKCRFHACNQLIRAFFSGKRILGWGTLGWSPKCHHLLIDLRCFHMLNYTIVFFIPINTLYVKMAQNTQLQAGKYCHFLFGEQNRKWRHFELHNCIQHTWKPPTWEKGMAQSINGSKMLTPPVWPVLMFGGSASLPYCHQNVITDTQKLNVINSIGQFTALRKTFCAWIQFEMISFFSTSFGSQYAFY